MTVTTTPKWQQTVSRKRDERDKAIQKFIDAQDTAFGVRLSLAWAIWHMH